MKRLLAIFILTFAVNITASAEVIETESKVTEAIVYLDSAQITREAEVDVKKGLNEIVFTHVPENLDEATLTVSAHGSARAKLLDAKIKRIFLEKPESKRVRELEAEIEKLEYEIAALNSERTVLNEQREFLRSIRLYSGKQIPEDLVTKMPKAEELSSLNDFLGEKWMATYTREAQINRGIRRLNDTLTSLRRELSLIRQARIREKRVISVEFDVEKGGGLTVVAGYLMYQANWHPEYDARVDYENETVELVCLGIVKQTSGEDWKGIKLSLSTAKPTVSGRMPELESWILRPYQARRQAYRSVSGQMNRAASVLGKTKKKFAYNIEFSKEDRNFDDKAQAERLYAQADEKLTSINYTIARLVDIKSDGTKHKLPVFSRNFSVELEYSSTPKLSSFAYLVAKVKNEQEQLLPAAVRVFLGDVYIGSSEIDSIGKGEEFDLYLGIDEGVKVKREKLEQKTKELLIAGIKRRNKIVDTVYKITIENYKGKNIKINLLDQVPVSQQDQIIVKVLEMDPEPDEKTYKDKKGVMLWKADIAAGQKREIVFKYRVEYPRDMNISL